MLNLFLINITFRRYYVDKVLNGTKFYGRILDIGGKKNNKRGNFRPPLHDIDQWEFLNIDATTNPDYCCSAEDIPLKDGFFDFIVMTEVAEHLYEPHKVINECSRLLKPQGKLVMTMPFLYPIHADPFDYQRWTPEKIKLELARSGFCNINVMPMGSVFAVIYDLIYFSLGPASSNRNSLINRLILKFIVKPSSVIFYILDNLYLDKSQFITTGFYVLAIK